MRYLAILIVATALAACSGTEGSTGLITSTGGSGGPAGTGGTLAIENSVCGKANAPTACGSECGSDSQCASGTFCNGNGICDAMCVDDSDCSGESDCTAGRCVTATDSDGGIGIFVGSDACAEVSIQAERIVPNIVLIVDQSGSMERDFANNDPGPDFVGPSRWDAARDALVGDNGVLTELDSIARFAFHAYTRTTKNSCAGYSLQSVELADNNAGPIATLYNSLEPGDWTPTAEAIADVTDDFETNGVPEEPTVYLLATDGRPNGCGNDDDHEANSVAAVEEAFDLGIETYVLGVSFDDSHLQDLANAGKGVDAGATLWTASDAGELKTALSEIVTRQIPCDLELDGEIVPSLACLGTVTFNHEKLDCDDASRGWKVVDSNTIRLLGSACEDWQSGDSIDLTAQFPCGAVLE